MVSYDLMDAIKMPPVESVFQHYVNSAGEAVEAFADKVVQVRSLCITWDSIELHLCKAGFCLNLQVSHFTSAPPNMQGD